MLIDSCTTQIKALGPSKTCNESKEHAAEDKKAPQREQICTMLVNLRLVGEAEAEGRTWQVEWSAPTMRWSPRQLFKLSVFLKLTVKLAELDGTTTWQVEWSPWSTTVRITRVGRLFSS